MRGLMILVVLASGTAARADTITHGSTTINMDFVPVGNPGNAADSAAHSGNPAGQGAVSYKYSIGKFEVTADQWAAVIGEDPSVGNAGWWNGSQWTNWSGSQATAGTSWNEAARFCNWLTTGSANSGYYTIVGGSATPSALSHDAYAAMHGTTYFIPTEDEWYKAAYYKGSTSTYNEYPTGNTVPMGVTGGTGAGTAVFTDTVHGVDPSAPADVNKAGGLSPYGTMGQGGNLWEWNESVIDSSRGLRGGAWYNNPDDLLVTSRYGSSPSLEDGGLGFRVASVPEPSTLALLSLGAVGLLACGLFSFLDLRAMISVPSASGSSCG